MDTAEVLKEEVPAILSQEMLKTAFRRYIKIGRVFHEFRDISYCPVEMCQQYGKWYGYEVVKGSVRPAYFCAKHGLFKK